MSVCFVSCSYVAIKKHQCFLLIWKENVCVCVCNLFQSYYYYYSCFLLSLVSLSLFIYFLLLFVQCLFFFCNIMHIVNICIYLYLCLVSTEMIFCVSNLYNVHLLIVLFLCRVVKIFCFLSLSIMTIFFLFYHRDERFDSFFICVYFNLID